MNTLIISEKPSVAARIAEALGKNSARRAVSNEKVSYYVIENKGEKTYVVAAVGHLFTIRQSDGKSGYPVLNTEWAPSYKVSKGSEFTKKYLDVIYEIAKKCDFFVNACDYDIEGTVIGTNIIKFAGNLKSAKRMKFSTTTTTDLINAYNHLLDLDIKNFYAGETRHMLDWLWGINLSRALTRAAVGWKITGSNSLSIGRVQGPTLALLAKREYEISNFVPKPFWRIFAIIGGIEFLNIKGDIFDKNNAIDAFEETKTNKNAGIVEKVEYSERKIDPYPPFDLTSLQLEASRVLHFDPSRTLAVAQSLYERSYISYPRTSSQKLPPSLGLKGIVESLAKIGQYKEYASLLLKGKLNPVEGKKTDEAHPAIFPTGVIPSGLEREEERLFDLIVRRFLSCFAEPASANRVKVTAKFGKEVYAASGTLIAKKGWLDIYPFVKIDEQQLPEFKEKSVVSASDVENRELTTQPPKRYTKAGLISELEKRNLGTKATRAAIIDTLFKRNYITGTSISVTKFGLSVFDALDKNCAMIVNEETTKKLEEDMEKISTGAKKEEEVIEEGKEMLLEALKAFDANKDKISEEIRQGLKESVNSLGKCPVDGGELVIRRSRAGKLFVACTNYPNCTNTYSLPQNAKIEPVGKICEFCKTPIIKVIRKGRRPFEMDLDPNCISKKDWNTKKEFGKAGEKGGTDQQEAKAEENVKKDEGNEKKRKNPKKPSKTKNTKKKRSKTDNKVM